MYMRYIKNLTMTQNGNAYVVVERWLGRSQNKLCCSFKITFTPIVGNIYILYLAKFYLCI